MNNLRLIVGCLASLFLIALGAYVIRTGTWQYRGGGEASPEQAFWWGVFCVIVGVCLLLIQSFGARSNKRQTQPTSAGDSLKAPPEK